MVLPMNILLDLALGLVLLSILHTSWKRGFISSLVRLVGTVAGFLLASFVSRPAAQEIYDRFLEKRVEDYVRQSLLSADSPLVQALTGLDEAGEAASHAISQFLSDWGVDFFSSSDASQMGSDLLDRLTQGTDPGVAVAQVAVKPLVMTVLQIAIFFVVLFVAGIVVKFAAGVGLGVNHIPLVGGLNRFAGLLCGGLYALLIGCVAANLLVLLAGIGGNQWQYLNGDILEDTFLIRWFLGLKDFRL